jgi:hypothetical protein
MNNLNSPANFESSPIASPMAPNLNASMPMMGGRRKRNRKTHKKGGMDPITPEKEKKFQVAPIDEKGEIIKPKNLFGNEEVVKDEVEIDVASDEDYGDLVNIPDAPKIVEDESKMFEDEEKKIDILDKLERGDNMESSGGSRRRKRRTRRNKSNKKIKKTKKRRTNKKTRKTRKLHKK